MNIESLTIGEARQIAALFNSSQQASTPAQNQPYEIGQPYLIRTVTMIDLGRVVEVTANEIILEDAAWIADTGRYSQALQSCDFAEVEPFPDGRVIVGRASVIDAVKVSSVTRSKK